MHDAIFWTAVVILLVVNGLLVQSLARYRRKSAKNQAPDQLLQNSVVIEAIWMFIPMGILITLLVLTMRAM